MKRRALYLGVSASVESYVVLDYHAAYQFVHALHLVGYLGAHYGVFFHLFPFLGTESARFSYDVLRYAGFSDVVEEGRDAEPPEVFFVGLHESSERQREDAHVHRVVIEVVVVVFYHGESYDGVRVGEDEFGHFVYDAFYGLRLGDPADAYLVHDGLYDVHGVVIDFHEFRFADGHGFKRYVRDAFCREFFLQFRSGRRSFLRKYSKERKDLFFEYALFEYHCLDLFFFQIGNDIRIVFFAVRHGDVLEHQGFFGQAYREVWLFLQNSGYELVRFFRGRRDRRMPRRVEFSALKRRVKRP